MARQTGTYAIATTTGESVRAFIPADLPPAAPPLDPASYEVLNRQAEISVARLAGVSGLVASIDWLLYSAVRKEALLTSLIEGTQATITDLFDEEAGLPVANADDVEEVTNYLAAYRFVREQLQMPNGLPLSMRLLRQAHARLLDGVRGHGRQPGEIRQTQNWIGGTRPGNAAFVPPPADRVQDLLSNVEHFIHDPEPSLPPLVRIALVHAQFETIHPFLDGNGRIGRLLIAALLEEWRLLPQPLLYVSGYLKEHQAEYYRRLSAIRTDGDWEGWVSFFLEAVDVAAQTAQSNIIDIASLINNDRTRVLAVPKSSAAAYRLFELLATMPKFTVERVRAALSTTFPTASAAVRVLEEAGIVRETSGKASNRTYAYQGYIDLMRR
ncbi:Fic family protein [Dyella subtropica]|uniref:Fic family protein n=1 Tax=Dyella subtropica TaxID=2992127 RepID=UPI0022531F56|nr:Fic family protein [Dyella subtropica]